jgi:hypothetical protein
VKEFFDDNESNPFEGPEVKSFWEITQSIPELYRSMLPERAATVQSIPKASARALCCEDPATDLAYNY